MKKIIYLLPIILISTQSVFSQKKLNTITLSTGVSLYNTKNLTVQFENIGSKKTSFGLITECLMYSDIKAGKYNLDVNKTFFSGGLFYKLAFSKRNFYSNIKIGALAGAQTREKESFAWYPFLSVEQSFCLSPSTQLFLSERLSWLSKYAEKPLQPALNLGFKFNL